MLAAFNSSIINISPIFSTFAISTVPRIIVPQPSTNNNRIGLLWTQGLISNSIFVNPCRWITNSVTFPNTLSIVHSNSPVYSRNNSFQYHTRPARYTQVGDSIWSNSSLQDPGPFTNYFIKLFHYSSIFLIGSIGCALYFSPGEVGHIFDLILGALIPLHGYLGMRFIINDYAPKPIQGILGFIVFSLLFVAVYGFSRLNHEGPGITETTKLLWKEDKPIKPIA